jgi:hypothetical protein
MVENDKPARHAPATKAELFLENAIFASRWLLAPFYLGLALSIVVVLITFMAEFFHLAAHAFTATESFPVTRISSPRSTTVATGIGRSGWVRSISVRSS